MKIILMWGSGLLCQQDMIYKIGRWCLSTRAVPLCLIRLDMHFIACQAIRSYKVLQPVGIREGTFITTFQAIPSKMA